MGLDQLPRYGEPQTRAARSCGAGKGLKQALAHCQGNAWPIVQDLDDNAIFLSPRLDGDALGPVGVEFHRFQRLARIAQQIEQNAKQLLRIGVDLEPPGNSLLQHDLAIFWNSGSRGLVDQWGERKQRSLRSALLGAAIAKRVGGK